MPLLENGSTVSRACSMDNSLIIIGGLGARFFTSLNYLLFASIAVLFAYFLPDGNNIT